MYVTGIDHGTEFCQLVGRPLHFTGSEKRHRIVRVDQFDIILGKSERM